MKKISFYLFFLLLSISLSLKKNTLLKSSKQKKYLTVESVDFESLCSNLEKGFTFYLNLNEKALNDITIKNTIKLENVNDNSITIPATCYVESGNDYIECETTESVNVEGTYKVADLKNFVNLNYDNVLYDFSLDDTVKYSSSYSNVDLDTQDQTIDYNENGPYSFYIDFLHLDSNSNTKIYYEDYENNDLIEIDDCEKEDDKMVCNVTPDTLPCDHSTCKYNIVVEDDCGSQQESILLTITAKEQQQKQKQQQQQQQKQQQTTSTSLSTQQKETGKLKVTSVDFDSLCSNLNRGFEFYLNLESTSTDSCDINDIIELENTEDPSVKIPADCYVNKGEDIITCETTESTNELGDYKVSELKNSIKLSCAKTKMELEPFSLNDIVGYSKIYSNVDLDTQDQTIDYGDDSPYSFYINFLHLDSNSNTKIYYEDYENNDLIEIENCNKNENKIVCNVTPDTLPCDYATCKYNIVVEDDCGIQQDSIVLKVVSKEEDDDNNTNNNNYYTYPNTVNQRQNKNTYVVNSNYYDDDDDDYSTSNGKIMMINSSLMMIILLLF
jgi:hypothetical protein